MTIHSECIAEYRGMAIHSECIAEGRTTSSICAQPFCRPWPNTRSHGCVGRAQGFARSQGPSLTRSPEPRKKLGARPRKKPGGLARSPEASQEALCSSKSKSTRSVPKPYPSAEMPTPSRGLTHRTIDDEYAALSSSISFAGFEHHLDPIQMALR